jgi:hypothetical protein
MAQALAHRSDGESLSAVIDRQPRRAVVIAASISENQISVALDGSIVNGADLRSQLG